MLVPLLRCNCSSAAAVNACQWGVSSRRQAPVMHGTPCCCYECLAYPLQDIDAILAGRTEKRQIGSAAGNTFSTATFAAEPAVTRPAEPVWLVV